MGNCLKTSEMIDNKINETDESSPLLPNLLPNINKLNKIYKKEICAICEEKSSNLTIIKDPKYPRLSEMVYCKKCRENLGY